MKEVIRFILRISIPILVMFLILLILYGFLQLAVKHHERNFEDSKKRTHQKGEIKKREVFCEENYGTYYIMDVPIEGKNHEYLLYKAHIGDDFMIHYPECKYCKKKGYTK